MSVNKIPIKTAQEIALMRECCRLTAEILDAVNEIIRPGISTEEINSFVHQLMISNGATPSTLNYRGFPKSICTSVNDVICHGIPKPEEILIEGDIINVDVTCFKNGFHGDSSRMYFVGPLEKISAEAKILVEITKQALWKGIEAVRPGGRVGDIGAAIQEFIASTGKGYGIVREYTGHGVGREFHEPPQVIHANRRGHGDLLKAGMTFTIEPMINVGSPKTQLSKEDHWTVRTVDGSLSAQWEHTILVTEFGYDVLTLGKR